MINKSRILYYGSLTSVVAEWACTVHNKRSLGTVILVYKQYYLSSERQKNYYEPQYLTLGHMHMHKTEVP